MATNGITSSKAPRTRRKGEHIPGLVDVFGGDAILEEGNGQRGRLASVQGQPITGVSTATTTRLLRQAGINVRRADGS